ncbi:hypothetical protein LJC10_06365, partial [Selenomonadales bacterium OttesenSCG-928-I06]|nr:hypothetical protein [Selenomonadales bacterium OttesenSCG-928-I06]
MIYIISITVVAIIFIVGFIYSRLMVGKYGQTLETSNQQIKPAGVQIYEVPGVNQQSDHPLGAVQSVIRGRIRFVFFGILLIAVSLFGLYALHLTDGDFYFERTVVNTLVGTVLLIGAVVWGLQLISYATYRVKLRRSGFEISSIFGTKTVAYKDVNFYLHQTIEHKYKSEGYRPIIMKTENFNFIWCCQIIFKDNRKTIVLKSSRYSWLKDKITPMIEALNKH